MIIRTGRQVNRMEQITYENISVKLPDGFKSMTEEEVKLYYNNVKFDSAFIQQEKKAVLGIVQNQNNLLGTAGWKKNRRISKQLCAHGTWIYYGGVIREKGRQT